MALEDSVRALGQRMENAYFQFGLWTGPFANLLAWTPAQHESSWITDMTFATLSGFLTLPFGPLGPLVGALGTAIFSGIMNEMGASSLAQAIEDAVESTLEQAWDFSQLVYDIVDQGIDDIRANIDQIPADVSEDLINQKAQELDNCGTDTDGTRQAEEMLRAWLRSLSATPDRPAAWLDDLCGATDTWCENWVRLAAADVVANRSSDWRPLLVAKDVGAAETRWLFRGQLEFELLRRGIPAEAVITQISEALAPLATPPDSSLESLMAYGVAEATLDAPMRGQIDGVELDNLLGSFPPEAYIHCFEVDDGELLIGGGASDSAHAYRLFPGQVKTIEAHICLKHEGEAVVVDRLEYRLPDVLFLHRGNLAIHSLRLEVEWGGADTAVAHVL